MLDRLLEGIIDIAVMIFIFSIFLDKINIIYQNNYQLLYISDKFYSGRLILDYFTESNNFTYNICNLTNKIFNLNNTIYFNNLKSLGITDPSELIIKDLNNNEEIKYGYNISSEDFQFNRVCYYNGSLYLIEVRVQ